MRIPVTNHGNSPLFIASTMIPPGETREFEEHQVPEHLKPQPQPRAVLICEGPMTVEMVEGLLKESPATIALAFPSLTAEHIDQLGAAEAKSKAPREDLLVLLKNEYKKRRAPAEEAEKAAAEGEADKAMAELSAKPAKDVIAALPTLGAECLTKLEALEKAKEAPRKTVLEAIAAEMLKLAGGNQAE